MMCSPFDLKDYFFGELPAAERSEVETHLAACAVCRDELRALSGTRALMLSVAEEEPPRRIAFVSDKVFEPRWWQQLWSSGPRLGFAGASVLALSILVHGFAARPEVVVQTKPAEVSTAGIDAEVNRRVRVEVARAMAESEARQTVRVLEAVNSRLRETDHRNRKDLLLVQEYLERMDKRNAMVVKRATYE